MISLDGGELETDAHRHLRDRRDLMDSLPRLKAYYARCCSRPAWQRTLDLSAERLGMNVDDIR